jgi:sugar/nucleoside kinase (ribokinase family)
MEILARYFCLDTVMIDVVLKVVALPQRGGDAVSSQSAVTPGGGFNSMSAAARHGMPSVYAGRVGSGPFSELAIEALGREGIDIPFDADPESDIGFCVVIVDEQGERTFVTAPGAEWNLRASDLDGLSIAAGDYVFLSGYNFVYPQLAAVIAPWVVALPREVVVALDPGPRVMDIPSAMRRNVLERVDWLLSNAEEAGQLTGAGTPEAAALALREVTGRRGVVVRDGAAGCLVALRAGELHRIKGFAVDVLDTNGAGDVHNGVFLSELARGTELDEAARRANAAAAMAIGQFGPATCPARDEVSRWFTEFP